MIPVQLVALLHHVAVATAVVPLLLLHVDVLLLPDAVLQLHLHTLRCQWRVHRCKRCKVHLCKARLFRLLQWKLHQLLLLLFHQHQL